MPPRRPKPIAVGKVRLRVHRGPRADGRWYWRADRQAGTGREVLWSGWGTPDEATAEVVDVLAARGEPGGQPAARQVRTVHDLLDCWVASQDARRDVAPLTQRNARGAASRLSGGLGSALVDRLDGRQLERYRDRSQDSGATIARDLKYLRQAWDWARGVGAVPDRDLPVVRVVRRDPVRSRYTPTRAEVAGLLAEARARSEALYRGLVLLAATGMRPGELVGLRWGAVARDLRSLQVAGKTGRRRIELHPDVSAELASWGRGDPEERVVGITAQAIGRGLGAASERMALPPVTPTGMRRYVVDALYRAGADPAAAAAQLGHSPTTALQTYRRATSDDQRRAVLAAGLGVPDGEGEIIDLPHDLPQRRR